MMEAVSGLPSLCCGVQRGGSPRRQSGRSLAGMQRRCRETGERGQGAGDKA